jgi:uroporphyrinogen decarboxylase
MTRIERVRAALAGTEVDRPPFTVWYHFGLQHGPAERTAQAHLEFLEAYDLDWLKVMNDYSYPMPAGLETLGDARDLGRLVPFDVTRPAGRAARSGFWLPASRASSSWTPPNAWNTPAGTSSGAWTPSAREPGCSARLGVVNDNLIRTPSQPRWRRDLLLGAGDIRVADARAVRALHAPLRPGLPGGDPRAGRGPPPPRPRPSRVRRPAPRLPGDALSWGDRDGGPSLAEARAKTSLVLMGGIGHTHFAYTSAAAIRAEIRGAVATAGPERLFLAPGCALATYTCPELIRAARDEARR